MTKANDPKSKGLLPGARSLPTDLADQAILALEVAAQKRRARVLESIEEVLEAVEMEAGPHKATVANDWTFPITVPPFSSIHDGFPSADLPSPAYTPVGRMLGKHKITGTKMRKVLHRMKGIVMQRHDVGPIIHVVIAPPPPVGAALSTLRTTMASRRCMFGAQKVMLEKGGPIGSCTLTNWPPTPMLFCGDPIPLPFACAPSSHWNTVSFSMSWNDYLLGASMIAIDIAVSFLFSKITFGKHAGEKGEVALRAAMESTLMATPKAALTSAAETGAVMNLGAEGQQSDFTVLDFHVWSYSIQLEKVVKDGEIDMMPVAELSPDDPDADDPRAMISFLPGRYGEPI
jgi:hypothetical protein